jgi:hypothetical protein
MPRLLMLLLKPLDRALSKEDWASDQPKSLSSGVQQLALPLWSNSAN